MGTIKVPDGYVLGITLGSEDINKPSVYEGSGMILSGGSIEVTWVGNLEVAGPEEGETRGNSEGNRFLNKIVIYDSEGMGRSIVELLWVEFGIEVGPCDGRTPVV